MKTIRVSCISKLYYNFCISNISIDTGVTIGNIANDTEINKDFAINCFLFLS